MKVGVIFFIVYFNDLLGKFVFLVFIILDFWEFLFFGERCLYKVI